MALEGCLRGREFGLVLQRKPDAGGSSSAFVNLASRRVSYGYGARARLKEYIIVRA
jgi:hypothetical protein